MSRVADSLHDPDEYLRQLEEQVDKLVIALDEWRQWKQEYEALRNDVQALSPTATRSALTQTRQAFKGELVDEKELVEIFGRDDSKKRDQVSSTVSNRLDYVSKNITTLTKQLEAAENKLATSRAVSDPEAADEDGLPLTEISEQLDEDGNVISYSLRRPGENQTQLVEALEKAGIRDLPSNPHDLASEMASDTPKPSSTVSPTLGDTKQQSQSGGVTIAEGSRPKKASKKKSVTFAEDTKEANEEKPSGTVQRLEELYRQAKDQESIISDPIVPADESLEDAELREDMIRYNKETMMYEMAPIVAELQLEEGSADDDGWNYDDSEDDDDDDEDQWGRSTSSVVDDEYRRQMLELKERLSKQTFGDQGAGDDDDEFAEGIGRITVKHGNPGSTGNDSKVPAADEDVVVDSPVISGAEKSVRFAPNLDIAEPSPPTVQPQPLTKQRPEADPLSDIIERQTSGENKTSSTSGRKPSRFRKERADDGLATQTLPIAPEKPYDTTRYAPSGPEGQTLASTILEHEPSSEVKEPDELDANLLHQQVTEEYYKMRNKMIGRHGGFLKENTDAIQPLEEEEGGPKRLSRFKAARLAKS
ncbi:Prefoldin subunit-domain-containing protein [Hypoxylon argillaceum]|nr:Prefoldin subunit-domain-containing protein [Hypoxylon argillaceum]